MMTRVGARQIILLVVAFSLVFRLVLLESPISTLEKDNHRRESLTKKNPHNETETSHNHSTTQQPSPETVAEWLRRNKAPPRTPGAFLHVGKTGGSTLSLQLANGCHAWVKKPCHVVQNETLISKLTTYYHVPDFDKLSKYDYEFYVWTVRDPLSRLLSAFTYEHVANVRASGMRAKREASSFFKPCFPTLERFSEHVGANPNDFDYPFPIEQVNYTNCSNLARASLHNRVKAFQHVYWNTGHVRSHLPRSSANASILVVRKEHLWDDWTAANQWLGQEQVATFDDLFLRQQFGSHAEMLPPVTKNISQNGRRRLCRALQQEYRDYFHLIDRAENLSEKDKRDAWLVAQEHCGELLKQT